VVYAPGYFIGRYLIVYIALPFFELSILIGDEICFFCHVFSFLM